MLPPFTTTEGREQGPGLDVLQATQDGHAGLELLEPSGIVPEDREHRMEMVGQKSESVE